jgi:hypothetical protein
MPDFPKNQKNKKMRAKLAKCRQSLEDKNAEYDELDAYTENLLLEKKALETICEAQYRELKDLKAERVELLAQIDFCKATETIKELMQEARRRRD